MATQGIDTVQPAPLFIPDISGLTRFISDTGSAPSRHIIEVSLKTILDANQIGLEVSEIEGDAILFYRIPGPTTRREAVACRCRNPLKPLFFRLFMHRKIPRGDEQTRQNFDGYCRLLKDRGHPQPIISPFAGQAA